MNEKQKEIIEHEILCQIRHINNYRNGISMKNQELKDDTESLKKEESVFEKMTEGYSKEEVDKLIHKESSGWNP